MVDNTVDVILAFDLVTMVERDEFDSACVLSPDNGYCRAVTTVIATQASSRRLLEQPVRVLSNLDDRRHRRMKGRVHGRGE